MTNPLPLELLAPAKNLACGLAAIDHGADAVYIGAPRFGARAAAGNSVEDIARLCAYAHQYGAKVYVTLNTLVYDDELEATRRLLSELREAHVDAILVQDMAVRQLVVADVQGSIPLHASTQTDNRTPEQVRWLRSLGFRRVVLARELSVEEVSEIHRQVPDVELEVFVHGALCVSYSGRCYVSQHLFGRSANRGQCAQVCRMKFDLVDSDGREWIHQRHLLSLRDLNQSDHLEELIEAGATSFKIEGRLKDADYVKNVVAAYSQRLDAIIARHPDRYCRASRGHCRYRFEPNLDKTFNRGFTTYFLHGRQRGISSPDTPKAIGEFVGTVKEIRRDSFTVASTARFANGDGLCFLTVAADRPDHRSQDGVELVGFRVNRAEGNRLFPHAMPRQLRRGMALYRNSDVAFERLLAHGSSERKIPLAMQLAVTADGFALSADGVTVAIRCEHQEAEKSPYDNIVRQLSRLGGTPYECSGVEVPVDFRYFIPSSLLSTLRRQLVEAVSRSKTIGAIDTIAAVDAIETIDAMATIAAVGTIETIGATDATDTIGATDPNIANRVAADFYGSDRPTAFELRPDGRPLMQCRYCLRFELGYCERRGGRRPQWREPLFLRLADGRRLRLAFDCRHCQMNIWER